MKDFSFRRNDGSTFKVQATDMAHAMVAAQSQHDQAGADKRMAAREATAKAGVNTHHADVAPHGNGGHGGNPNHDEHGRFA